MRWWLGMGWWLAGLATAAGLEVMVWNIHHGEGLDDRLDLERIAAVIEREKPDLVALQEVDRASRRSGGVDQAAELGRLCGMESVFGEALEFQGGGYGLAVLSRLPVRRHRIHRLPGEGEPRIALEVVVERDGEPLSFVSVHLCHRSAEDRLRQAKVLEKLLGERRRVVLGGDFNAEADSPVLKVFGDRWERVPNAGPTHPADGPRRHIDHVLVRGLVARGEVRVVKERVASDHRPLRLRLRAP